MTNSTKLDRLPATAEQQVLSFANKSLYHHKSGESPRPRKLGTNLPTLTREELTELIKHGLSATIDEELFMMKTSSNNKTTSRRRGSHHRVPHHHHHSANPENEDHPDNDGIGLDATKVKRRRSAEEIFYATINGEDISVSEECLEEPEDEEVLAVDPKHVGSPKKHKNVFEKDDYYYDEDDKDEFPDSFSFANFDVIKDERMGELLKHDIRVNFFNETEPSRIRRTRKKHGATAFHQDESAVAEESGSSGGETTTASCSIPSDEDDLSITDIKQYVMDHLSEEVKALIPEETWAKILSTFDDADDEGDDDIESMMTTKSTKDALKRLLTKSRSKKPSVDIDVVEGSRDEMSLVSDMTAHTAMVKREEEQKNKKQVSFQTEDEAQRSKDQDKTFGYPSPLTEHTPKSKDADGSRKGLSVAFSHIDVRYYERILELNPSVTSGPPIGIGWKYRRGTTYSVDEWEMERKVDGGKRPRTAASSGATGPRTAASHLILPRAVREKMLYELGYTQQDIAQALRTVRKLKDQRRTTVDNLNVQSVEEAVEKATDLMKNMLRVGRKRGVVR